MTTHDYAKRRGISTAAVTASVNKVFNGHVSLPYNALSGVTKIERPGREFILTVNLRKILKGKAKKRIRK